MSAMPARSVTAADTLNADADARCAMPGMLHRAPRLCLLGRQMSLKLSAASCNKGRVSSGVVLKPPGPVHTLVHSSQ